MALGGDRGKTMWFLDNSLAPGSVNAGIKMTGWGKSLFLSKAKAKGGGTEGQFMALFFQEVPQKRVCQTTNY